MEVPALEKIEIEHFVSEHLHLLLLQIRHLALQVDHLLLFDCISDHLPFLFELEALVVVLDAPLVTASLHFGS